MAFVTGKPIVASLTPQRLNEIVGGKILHEGSEPFSGVSIDSRTMRPGELFVALKGDRFDGHDFLDLALRTGAGAITEGSHSCPEGKTVILVKNSLRALQDLARHVRKGFDGPVVGVVGSNGKTTTKELVSSMLCARFEVLRTPGNHNNHIGMPLAMARCPENAGVMVLEMGTNRPGDVAELCGIAEPDIGVITNIGSEHLEGFGSLGAVRDAELEILPYLKQVVVNADDAFLMEGIDGSFSGAVRTFGVVSPLATVTARDIVFLEGTTRFTLCADGASIQVTSHLSGRFNLYNCLAAASAALSVGLALDEVKKGIESFRGVEMRFGLEHRHGATFLNDVYNANPSSMEEAVKELERFAASSRYGRAIAVLGDMLELGDYAEEAHKSLGRRLSRSPVALFIGVGPLMSLAVSGFDGKGIALADSEEAGAYLNGTVREGDIVLVKGSRGMRMERVLAAVRQEEAPPGAQGARGHSHAL
ncbi:MAG: UDP-N-acetylmuramoyl-tripeptide--D-alanyl-D-alanine ligase [Chloroflexota bacterium]